jgi:hypothetical protein
MEIKRNGQEVSIYYDWMEITSIYRKLAENPGIAKTERLREFSNRGGRWDEDSAWFGANRQEMLGWLENGYEFENKVDPDSLPSVAYDRPRARYTDDPEGEFSYDLYIQGETEHFLTKPKRRMMGGIRLNCQYDFNSNVGSKVIAEYGQWIGSVIQNLQAKGFDVEVNLYTYVKNAYSNFPVSKTYVNLSKFGERVMPFDWSSAFSPGGFRHLFFLAYIWPDEMAKDLNINQGLGQAIGKKWDIEWEPKAREIRITNNCDASSFPMKDMTKRFESWTE